jgi:pSer/pThr/pTyr-binding forkhead associated (FHA) protein
MPFFLKILAAPKTEMVGVKVPLVEGENLLGRSSPPCQIKLEGTKVSKKHCAIILSGGGLQIKDLGSSNGIYLNGKKTGDSALKAKDRLVIGEFTLEITAG